jgi:hypothetical protein
MGKLFGLFLVFVGILSGILSLPEGKPIYMKVISAAILITGLLVTWKAERK